MMMGVMVLMVVLVDGSDVIDNGDIGNFEFINLWHLLTFAGKDLIWCRLLKFSYIFGSYSVVTFKYENTTFIDVEAYLLFYC